jgi:hypothetical protein
MSSHVGAVLLSHPGDGTASVTWPRHDVDAESYWQ